MITFTQVGNDIVATGSGSLDTQGLVEASSGSFGPGLTPATAYAVLGAAGTPEIVRWGMTVDDMPALAGLIARGLRGNDSSEQVAADVTAFRQKFRTLHFMN